MSMHMPYLHLNESCFHHDHHHIMGRGRVVLVCRLDNLNEVEAILKEEYGWVESIQYLRCTCAS